MLRARTHLSTPFRLAISIVLLLSVTYLITGFIVYDLAKKKIAELYEQRLTQIYKVLSGNDEQDLIEGIKQRIAVTQDHESVFLLTTSDGKVIAGNMPVIRSEPGLSVISAEELGLDDDYRYHVLEGTVNGQRLVVGISDAEIDELGEVIIESFGWALLVTVALAAAGAVSVALRAQRRINVFTDAMRKISKGDLSARISLIGNNDDIDVISAKVNEALDHLSVAVEGLQQVSSDIAHDLKTPLNRLKIIIEDAAEKAEKGENNSRELDEAIRESDQINETFSALLRISQIESGERKSRFIRVDLGAILNKIQDIYGDVASDSGMKLLPTSNLEIGAEVLGDQELLVQMFANLVENSIRHSPNGTEIEYSLTIDENGISVCVSDNGPGIPETEQENVLRRLYRLEKSRTTPGSGLGLSMVKAIADLHNADLTLGDNSPGLKVTIRFPKFKDAK